MAFEKVQISGKFYPAIASVGETPNFVDFTQEEISSNDYSKVGVKSFKLDANVVTDGITTNTSGKVALVEATEAAAVAYLETIFTDAANQHDVKVYVLGVNRQEEDDETVTETGDYVAKNDIMNVDARFEIHVVPVALLIDPVTITKLDVSNFEIKIEVSNDLINVVDSASIVFDSFSGVAPIPTELDIFLSTTNGLGSKTFTYTELTFDDPVDDAIGETYTILLDLKDAQGNTLKSISQDVIVQGI